MVGLTLALAALIIIALTLALYGGKFGGAIAFHVGLSHVFHLTWNVLQWPVLTPAKYLEITKCDLKFDARRTAFSLFAMFLALSLGYCFGPNVEERRCIG